MALSEGVHGAEGKTLVESKEKDSHGNVQLSGSGALGDLLAEEIKAKLGSKLRVRSDTFGYLQRSFPGVVSPVDAREARAVGRMAARLATGTKHAHGSVAILRVKEGPYGVTFAHTELASVAKETRPMEPALLKGDNDVDPSFLDYVRPLVGELPHPARLSDFPAQ